MNSKSQNVIKKREAILNSALNFGRLPSLSQAFTAARDNELTGRGIVAEMLEVWAIKKVQQLKQKLNSILGFVFLPGKLSIIYQSIIRISQV